MKLYSIFGNKQFALWMSIYVPLFIACVVILEVLGLPTVWVFLSGLLFTYVMREIQDWLIEWHAAEEIGNSSLDEVLQEFES